MEQLDLSEIIKYIDPSSLNYQEWVNVGMALKHEGYTASEWDAWSANDTRYHSGECFKKWDTFKGTGIPVTGGTIVQMAQEHGFSFNNHEDKELDWNDTLEKDEMIIIDKNWIEGKEIKEPKKSFNPVKELIKYLETLFDSSENVGFVTQCWTKEDGRFAPKKGVYDRTAGQLIEELNKCNGDIGSVIGDYNKEAGAWIRFNPLNGKGVKNDDVTEFRYALVESDSMDIEKQNAIIRELELPVAVLVNSGNKSLHAIVRINAADYSEYRKRVDYLYQLCRKNGLDIDQQNRNPSRLSRMPGIIRNGKKQFIVDTNIGKRDWVEWKEWIESINDDLPEPENLNEFWNNLPDLAPSLIDGLLRQGHKMLIAGPSKAGKSFALIEMCISIAEGKKWFDWQCAKGKIMYVNLELDRASCLHRFKDVYDAMNIPPENINNIDIWNLRGKSIPMDKLAPKLIRRAAKKNYIAIIIDPIYKVITGDENSADQMANFCNQFDKICTELGTAVIYCHHHSKGGQGGKKSMDRASGSGVFARDPDALMDLIELDVSESLLKQESNKAVCETCLKWLKKYHKEDVVSQDDECSESNMIAACRFNLKDVYEEIIKDIALTRKRIDSISAWRIEGTLREFPKFKPVNLWFDYPTHKVDKIGVLKDISTEEIPSWKKNFTKKKSPEDAKKEKIKSINMAYEACSIDEKVTIKVLAEYLGVSEKTTRNRLKEHGGFWIDEGVIGKK
ncbi:MAG: AAA family ATPase [Eubacterium sp.]